MGLWGDGVEFPPRRLSPSRVARMIACVMLSPSQVRELGCVIGNVRSRGESVRVLCGILLLGVPETSSRGRLRGYYWIDTFETS